MTTFTKLLAVCSVLLCFGCSQESELGKSMHEMKDAMKTMKQSDEAGILKQQLTAFSQAVERAKLQKVAEKDQAVYDEGLNKLVEKIKAAEAALAAGQVDVTKSLLKEMQGLQKDYHDQLGVH